MKPLPVYLYWQCVACGALSWTDKRPPGMCLGCGADCWRSPPLHPQEGNTDE